MNTNLLMAYIFQKMNHSGSKTMDIWFLHYIYTEKFLSFLVLSIFFSCGEEMVNITCGGQHSISVYSTAVPMIVSLNLSIPHPLKTNTSVSVASGLSIKRRTDEVRGLNRITMGSETADSVLVRWFSQTGLYNKTGHPVNKTLMTLRNTTSSKLDGNFTRILSHLEFFIPGYHNVCVQASNLFSYLETCTVVDVVAPITDLQLVAISQEESMLDNVSSNLSIPTSKAIRLKYAIGSGSRPEFLFNFGDGSPVLVDTYAVTGRAALRPSCVVVLHFFKSCGNITINVTASNSVSIKSVGQLVFVNPFIDELKIINKSLHDCLYVKVNTFVVLEATVRVHLPDCLVFYEWNFHDSSPSVTTEGELITVCPKIPVSFPSYLCLKSTLHNIQCNQGEVLSF